MCLRKNRKFEMDITRKGDKLSYAKVSVAEQDATSQKNCLTRAGAIRVFPYVISGCSFVISDQFGAVCQ